MLKLLPLKEDSSFCEKWLEIKNANKAAFANYVYRITGIAINPEAMIDVQIKRIHEYKRQMLFGLFIISQYLKIKNNPKAAVVPRTFILSGKAAPGYFIAKLIIKFINSVADIINNDKAIGDKLKVVFLENYRVSLAEKIFPASELSEQISTAGTEASGTGCMKFMMNGALTIGTFDGANVEITEEVGKDNIFIFGLNVEAIQRIKKNGYYPQEYINRCAILKEIISLIRSNFFSPVDYNLFSPIIDNLSCADPFFICADFDDYCNAQDKVSALYCNKNEWVKKSIVNVAKSGKFSSDRTIKQYADEIWKISYNSSK